MNPRELIRLRLVSKQFNNIARDTQLWKASYAIARLPGPPGPFSWRSTRSLERTLVPSGRFSHTWASQSLKDVSVTQGPRYKPINTPNILFGRLFISSAGKQVFSKDLETGSRQMIWETDQRIDSFKISSMGFPDALRVYLAVSCIHKSEPEDSEEQERIKLVVFSLQDETSSFGPAIHEMDLPKDAQSSDLDLYQSPLYFESDYDSGTTQPMLVDPRTYALYRFPRFHSDLLDPGDNDLVERPFEVFITGPYISVMYRTWRFDLVQIFTVPNQQPHPVDGDLELRLTHQAIPGTGEFHNLALIHSLRDPVVNSLTGDTILRFLARDNSSDNSLFSCVDFTLPATASNSTEISSLAVNQKHLFETQGIVEDNVQLHASSDGYARGLCIVKSTSLPSQPITKFHTFSIDASGEECTAVFSDVFES